MSRQRQKELFHQQRNLLLLAHSMFSHRETFRYLQVFLQFFFIIPLYSGSCCHHHFHLRSIYVIWDPLERSRNRQCWVR